jgi:putative two-component system response regulator
MTDMLSILIVDDNRTSLALMDMLARKLPNCSTQLFTDPRTVANALGTLDFDLAVIHHRLPGINAIEMMRRIWADSRLGGTPVVIVTAEHDGASRDSALQSGASDVLQTPIKPLEFRNRLTRLLRRGEGPPLPRSDFSGQYGLAEEVISAFARAAGYKDRELPLHAGRMARYCSILAHHLGLPDDVCAEIRLAAPLHDIGKVGLRDEVLLSRTVLTDEQRRVMAEHTRIGHAILSAGRTSVMKLAAEIALTHHERWDGKGYPQGLKGEQIPLVGRIAAVADVFDALTSVRSYKCAWSVSNAFDYLSEHAGAQFDPRCVAAFQTAREEVSTVRSLMPDLLTEYDADAA